MTPVDPHIFRAYDIRGDVRTQLTPAVVRDIGAALADAHFPPSSTLAVACDARTHSPALVQALIEGLTRQGVNVVNYGQTTTPMLYFALHQHGHDGGVMVTGSHNPIFDNGLKICRKTSSFVSDDIQAIWARLSSPIAPADRPGSLSESEILDDYREAIVSRVSLSGRIRVVVDGGNGVAGPFALDILSALGAGVEPLFCEPDG
ncbi:MAG: phosphomannomutase/phosphoglucomutase, partial [Proteobacteria bacterium]|nr:phosphomannomutase/phosphoglucomutase [Pseudomonadota bacterium]